jgi:tRNA splicing endonuclease
MEQNITLVSKVVNNLDTEIINLTHLDVNRNIDELKEEVRKAQLINLIKTTLTKTYSNRGWSDEEILNKTLKLYEDKYLTWKNHIQLYTEKKQVISFKDIAEYNEALYLYEIANKYLLVGFAVAA